MPGITPKWILVLAALIVVIVGIILAASSSDAKDLWIALFGGLALYFGANLVP